jgi:A/G-specific adenine glycosylase
MSNLTDMNERIDRHHLLTYDVEIPIYAQNVSELTSEERVRVMRNEILDWTRSNARVLPWRTGIDRDPWGVLVSEFMLVQTQASRVALTFPRFLDRFPTAYDLAHASVEETVREWMGLGYYRRARALRACAIEIVERFDGHVPHRYEDLTSLPGVGPYIANAVRAIAFAQHVGAVDTNVRRIIARTFGLPSTTKASAIQLLADALVSGTEPGLWTEALFDFGASVCQHKSPRCADCPLAEGLCASAHAPSLHDANTPERRPQSRFAGSRRQLRGLILRRLTESSSYSIDLLNNEVSPLGFSKEQVKEIVYELVHEGLLASLPRSMKDRSADWS